MINTIYYHHIASATRVDTTVSDYYLVIFILWLMYILDKWISGRFLIIVVLYYNRRKNPLSNLYHLGECVERNLVLLYIEEVDTDVFWLINIGYITMLAKSLCLLSSNNMPLMLLLRVVQVNQESIFTEVRFLHSRPNLESLMSCSNQTKHFVRWELLTV